MSVNKNQASFDEERCKLVVFIIIWYFFNCNTTETLAFIYNTRKLEMVVPRD